MTERSEPRFIVRGADGREIPVASVDELEARIANGDVGPDAELYDASTDAWTPARDLPVFRFILEELAADGRLPEALEGLVAESADLDASQPEAAGSTEPEGEEELDPFAFRMELVDDTELDGAGAGGEGDPDEGGTGPMAHDPGHDDLALEVGRGLQVPDEPEPSEEPEEESWFTPAEEGGIALPDPRERLDDEDGDSVELWEPERPGQEPPPPPSRPRRLEARPTIVIPMLVAALGVGVGIYVVTAGEEDPFLEPLPSPTLELPDAPPFPPGLAEAGGDGLAGIRTAFLTVGDSLRSELGLPGAPPSEWLSGYYLANAGEFPGVPAFWEGYAEFVERLRGRDVQAYMDGAVAGIADAELVPAERQALEEYFRERFQLRREWRQQRYEHLLQAARAALHLHRVLEEHQDVIRHSPAVGAGISADPILEAEIPEGPLRAEVDRTLDRIFAALDRSRGGGAPSTDGLRTELFLNFGDG